MSQSSIRDLYPVVSQEPLATMRRSALSQRGRKCGAMRGSPSMSRCYAQSPMLPLLGLTACGFSFGTESRTIAEEERFCAALTLERCEREFDDDVPRCRIRRASWASPGRGCFEASQDLVCAINLSCAGFTETFARDLDGGVWRWSDDCTIAGFAVIDGGDFAERHWQDCTTKCGPHGREVVAQAQRCRARPSRARRYQVQGRDPCCTRCDAFLRGAPYGEEESHDREDSGREDRRWIRFLTHNS